MFLSRVRQEFNMVLEMETTQEYQDVTHPDVTNPDVTNPDATSPDVTSQNVQNSNENQDLSPQPLDNQNGQPLNGNQNGDDPDWLPMTVDDVQKALKRSRASIYRYANTDPSSLNLPYKSDRLNPEWRTSKEDPLLFHPNEVERFARDVLGIQNVTLEVHESPQTTTHKILNAILQELQDIRRVLESRN